MELTKEEEERKSDRGRVMKERPILFSTPMVQAIDREISPKTTTRRILKDVPEWVERFGFNECVPEGHIAGFGSKLPKFFKNPYGKVGDRLWVRETWRPTGWGDDFDWLTIEYKAGGQGKDIIPHETWDEFRAESLHEQLTIESLARGGTQIFHPEGIHSTLPERALKWRPSIFMPRNACRTLLEITKIRVERLWDITDEDAIAEGARHFPDLLSTHPYGRDARWSMELPTTTEHCLGSPKYAFLSYWNDLNAKRGYGAETKPWVWVINFKKVEESPA